jgi:hypothetical protein
MIQDVQLPLIYNIKNIRLIISRLLINVLTLLVLYSVDELSSGFTYIDTIYSINVMQVINI